MGMWACVWKWVSPTPTRLRPEKTWEGRRREERAGEDRAGWRAEPGGPKPRVPELWALLWQQGFLISSQTLTIPCQESWSSSSPAGQRVVKSSEASESR